MSNGKEELRAIKEITQDLKRLMNRAYCWYYLSVDSILKGEITDIKQIELIMDGLVDFGNEERFVELYKTLCRHIYRQYPELVGEHVSWVWRIIQAEVKAEDNAEEPTEVMAFE